MHRDERIGWINYCASMDINPVPSCCWNQKLPVSLLSDLSNILNDFTYNIFIQQNETKECYS